MLPSQRIYQLGAKGSGIFEPFSKGLLSNYFGRLHRRALCRWRVVALDAVAAPGAPLLEEEGSVLGPILCVIYTYRHKITRTHHPRRKYDVFLVYFEIYSYLCP